MKFNIIAPIAHTGYGIAATNIVHALMNKGVEVSLFPIGGASRTKEELQCDPKYVDNIIQAIVNSQFFDKDAHCLRIWHQFDMAQFVGRGKHIGMPIFELDTFTELERHHLNSLDEIWVNSKWAKGVVENNEINVDTHVVPLGVDLDIFRPVNNIESNKTIFLSAGKIEIRKGHDFLGKAFNEAFTEEDDVELWMLWENPFYTEQKNQQWADFYKNSKLGEKIRIWPRQNTQKDVYNIMGRATCGVFPSRAEGFNLELLEMMSIGKPVIATNYSAHTEYCTDENCYLIPIDATESAIAPPWFNGQGNWAKISEHNINQLINYMRTIHANKIRTNEAGIQTGLRYDWSNIADRIMELL